ncbi:hypothetical protein [Sinorhizobium fredii]|uniref:hypothetical protein n=1 Tax=Rhizobium fredii TaxID=380 RepID=UPI00056D4C64|nr:hypothetical protein [Sinorhizobium fredii]
MQTPLEKRKPAASEAAGFQNSAGETRYFNSTQRASVQAPALPHGALYAVKVAWRALLEAQFRLDEHGLECPALVDVQAETGAISAVWQGRRPSGEPEAMPAYFIDGMKEWRRRNGRSY